jgi:hypothetical protein
MSRILAVMLSVVLLAALLYGCGKTSSPVEKQNEPEGAGQADTIAPELSNRPAPPVACPARSKLRSRKRTAG